MNLVKHIKAGRVMDIAMPGKSSSDGWKLSILGKSVADSEFLVDRLYSYLRKNDIAHKWGTSRRIEHRHPVQSKKILTVYVPNDMNHLELAEALYGKISDYKGWYDIKTPNKYSHYAGAIFYRNDRDAYGNYITATGSTDIREVVRSVIRKEIREEMRKK